MNFLSNHSASDEEDDGADLFSPSNSETGLKSIFAKSEAKKHSQESLTYQGQKKKIENVPEQTLQNGPNLKMSGPILVDSFVFDKAANKYNPMGKAGLIITPTKNESEVLVLYRSKQQTLASVQISTENFRFDVQTETFSSFVDARGLAWSVNFASAESSELFSMNLARAKFRSSKTMTVQNLSPGQKDSPVILSKGDSCDFELSSWIVEENLRDFGVQIKSGDPTRIVIGSNEWNESLQGMKVDGSKVLILNSNKLETEMGNYPPNAVVAMKLKVLKKIVPKTSIEENRKSLATIKVPEKEFGKVTENEDEQIKVTEYEDEQIIVTETKARIDRLVSKVGQPVMLQPKDLSKQKDETTKKISESSKEEIREMNGNSIKDDSPIATPVKRQSSNENDSSPLKPNPPPRRSNPANPDSDNLVRMIFSEQRLQNADMRMSVKRLEDKLDDLLNKLIPPSGQDKKPVETSSKADDVDELQRLKGELEMSKKTVERLQEKNKFLENDLKKAENENVKLKNELEASNQYSNEEREKYEKLFSKYISLEKIAENQREENKTLQNCSEEEEVSKMREEIEKSLSFQSEEVIKKTVRKIVNKAFKSIKSQMEVEGGENGNEVILKQIAFNFRNVTDQLLSENVQN